MTLYLIALFLMAAALVFGLGMSWDNGDDRMKQLRERLQLVEQAERRQSRASLALIRDDLLSEIPALNKWLSKVGRGDQLKNWLGQAGIRTLPGKFVLTCVASGLGCGMAAILFFPWYGFLAALPGSLLPVGWASHRRTKRLALFQQQFPEAIELLVRASRAGHPPSSALELIANEMPEPIAGEFRQVFDQQRFGLPLRDCLLNLAERIPLVDVQFFSIAVIIQRESGGNLAEILDKLSSLIRERVKIMREVKTHTAQGRMTMWVLMALAPIMLVAMLVLSHDFVMPMFSDPLGREMLAAGVVLQIIGLYLLGKVIDIKV
ncbi:MAG TPA: type II secretion system F family protein [Terriglobales bacterium]|nr:type II secretion system F family protein [Terriglobales bacterium]